MTVAGLSVGSLVAMSGVLAIYLVDARRRKQTGYSTKGAEPAAEAVRERFRSVVEADIIYTHFDAFWPAIGRLLSTGQNFGNSVE